MEDKSRIINQFRECVIFVSFFPLQHADTSQCPKLRESQEVTETFGDEEQVRFPGKSRKIK